LIVTPFSCDTDGAKNTHDTHLNGNASYQTRFVILTKSVNSYKRVSVPTQGVLSAHDVT